MARISVIGGTGYAGSNVLAEAVERGHAVASISRNRPTHRISGIEYLEGSILDGDTRSTVLANSDVVVVAVAPRGDMAGRVKDGIKTLASDAEQTEVRLGIIGGAGSLHVAEGGPRLFDTPYFPAEFYSEALEMTAALDDLRAASERLAGSTCPRRQASAATRLGRNAAPIMSVVIFSSPTARATPSSAAGTSVPPSSTRSSDLPINGSASPSRTEPVVKIACVGLTSSMSPPRVA